MGYKRKTGRKYKRATQVNHKVLKGISAGLTAVLGLHKGSEKARGFNPGMNQADGMFKYTYFK